LLEINMYFLSPREAERRGRECSQFITIEPTLKVHAILIDLILIAIFTASFADAAHAATPTRFSIVYTNDVMGEVEPCG
jgi:hypothetical protein